MSDLVERLREYASDDHERGCQGREYDCTCGYDGKRDPLMVEAAKTIESLRDYLAKANMEVDRLTRTNQAKREHRDKLLQAKATDAARIEALEAALRFYAGWPQGPAGNIAPLLIDAGHIARAALGEKA